MNETRRIDGYYLRSLAVLFGFIAFIISTNVFADSSETPRWLGAGGGGAIYITLFILLPAIKILESKLTPNGKKLT